MQNTNELPDWMLSKAGRAKRLSVIERKARTAQIATTVILIAAAVGVAYGNGQMVALGYSA